jgi:DNA-binding Lrp family transcriptional regulator
LDRKLYVLRELLEDPRISQRRLAKKADLSLGTINALMQQLENDLLIESRVISGKSTEYNVTEQGHLEKAELTRLEAIHCYQFISEVKGIIKNNLEKLIESDIHNFIFVGQEDEIYKLVKMTFNDLRRFYEISYELYPVVPEDISNEIIAATDDGVQNKKIIIWDTKNMVNDHICHILLMA